MCFTLLGILETLMTIYDLYDKTSYFFKFLYLSYFVKANIFNPSHRLINTVYHNIERRSMTTPKHDPLLQLNAKDTI